MTHPPLTSTTRIGLVAGVTALVMALSLPGQAALGVGEAGNAPAPDVAVALDTQAVPDSDSISQSQVASDRDPISQLAVSGVNLAVTGKVLELADVPEGQPSVFIAPPSGGALALDEATLSVPVEPGQDVSAVVEVPGEVVTEMNAEARAELVASPGLDTAINGSVVAADSPAGEVLVEAASEQEALVSATDLTIVASPQAQAAPPAPKPHQLEFVFLSKAGRGKFWSQAELDSLVRGMADYWVPRSRGAITEFKYSYDSIATITADMACNTSSWDIFDAGAQALGYSGYTDFILSGYYGSPRHLVVISLGEEQGANCLNSYGGIANMGSTSTGLGEGGNMHLILRNQADYSYNIETFIHEMGHNLSLYHASVGACPSGVIDGPFATSGAVCGVTEYGDKWNIMGSSSRAGTIANKLSSGLNGKQKETLRLIDASAGLRTIDSGGTYDIQLQAKTVGHSNGVEAIKIVETALNREYSVEYDPTAGGVTIRRVSLTRDTSANIRNSDTIILSPNQTTLAGPQVFTAGQLFAANSGSLTVEPVQISNDVASVHIVFGPEPSPSLSLSTNTWPADASGGESRVTVTTNQPSWSAVSDQNWLTVNPASGVDGESMTLAAAANTSSSPRQGTITVTAGTATATLEVSQAGSVAWVRPAVSVWEPGRTAQETQIVVNTNQSYWNAWSDAWWVNTSPSWGRDGSSLALRVYENSTDAPRTATVRIQAGSAVETITVTQAGETLLSSWDKSCSIWDGMDGGSCSMQIYTNASAGWFIEPGHPDWIVPVATRNRTGYSYLYLNILPNPSLEQRVGVIRIGAAGAPSIEYTITEAGVQPRVSLADTFWGPSAAAQSTAVVVSTTYPSWSAVSDQDWLTVTPSSGADGSALTVSVAENTAETWRMGTVTVSVTDSWWVRETFTVTQAGRSGQTLTLEVSPSNLTFGALADGQEQVLTVTTNVPKGWSMSSYSWWGLLDGVMSDGPVGATSMRLKVSQSNSSVVPQFETLVFNAPGVRPVTVTVRQDGGEPEVEIPDPRFRGCLSGHVRDESTGEGSLTVEALASIETLDCSGWWAIKSIEGIEYLTNVKSVDLNHSFLSDLGPLENASLPKLVSLDVSSSAISRFPDLSGLTALTDVSLAYSSIQSIGTGSPMLSVKRLDMSCSDTQQETTGMLSDLRGLAGRFPNLERFTANTCSVSDVSPLAPLKQTQFIMPFNMIRDISALRDNPGLAGSTFTAQYVTLPSTTVGQPSLFVAIDQNGQRLPVTFAENPQSSYDVAAGTITHQAPVVARGYFYSSDGRFSGSVFQTAIPDGGLVIDQAAVTVTAAAQSITPAVSVTTTANTGWVINAGYPTWLTPSRTAGPAGQSQVSFAVTANTSTVTRTGQVTFTAAGVTPVTFAVTQAGTGATPLTVAPAALTFEAISDDLTQEVRVSTSAADGWKVEHDQAPDQWLWVDQRNGFAEVSLDVNPSVLPRSARLVFTASGAAPVTVTVTQEGAAEEVTIPDVNFRNCLREQSRYQYLSADQLAQIEGLSCSGYDNRGIRSLVGINYLTNLQGLSLYDHLFTDLEPLKQAGLKELETISLSSNPLTQFPDLSGFSKLTQIDLNYTPIKAIGVGAPVPSVTDLYMSCGAEESGGMGQLADLTGLADRFPNLEFFSASFCGVRDVSPLAPLQNTAFYLGWNQITDLSPLAGTPGMEKSNFDDQNIDLPQTTVGQPYSLVVVDGDGKRLPLDYNDDVTYDLDSGLITYHKPTAARIYFDGYYISGYINQNALDPQSEPDTITLSQTTWDPAAIGESQPVTVTTNQSSWSAVSDQAWLTVNPASGASGALMTVTAAANSSSSPRQGTITVTAGSATTTLKVTQAGKALPPVVTVSASLGAVAAAGGTAAAVTTVTTSVPTGWRLRPGLPTWLTASTQTGPQGETVVSFSVAANTARTARVFEVGFEADAATTALFKIAQSGTGTASASLSRTSYSAANSGAETTTTVTTNQALWTATSSQAWLTVSPAVGVTGDVITVQAAPNPTNSSRSATVTVRAGTLSRTLTVRQAAGTLTVSPSGTYATPVAGGTRSVTVTTSQPTGWAVSSNASWVTVSAMTGTSGQSFTIQTVGNDGPARTATVTVSAGAITRTISVTQPTATLTLSPSGTYAAPAAGGTRSVTVTTSVPAGWSVSSNSSWVTVTPTNGTSAQSFAIQATGNDGPARVATVTVTAAGLSRTISVTQATATLTLSPSGTYAAPAAGGTRSVTVTTSVPAGWSVSSNSSWVTVTPTNGTSAQSFAIQATGNDGPARTATVTVTAGTLTRTVSITQVAATLTVSPSGTYAAPVAGGTRSVTVTTSVPAGWSVSSNASWVTVTPTNGTSGQSFAIQATANSGPARVATVTVSASGLSRTISITQARYR